MEARGRKAAADTCKVVSREQGRIGRRPPRRAPEVDMEWPAEEPATIPDARQDLFPIFVIAGAVASLAAIMMPGASVELRRWAVSLLAGLCGAVAVDEAVRWRARRPAAERALERAAWALYLEEEPSVVMRGLQGLELPGRAGTCLRVAVRCLERAGRCRRVERGMRREAARWMRRAREEMER